MDALIALAASPWALIALGLLVALDGLIPPVPSEALVSAMAAIAVTSHPSQLAAIIAIAALGSVAGDLAAFWLGGRLDLTRARFTQGARARGIIGWAAGALTRSPLTFFLPCRFLPGGRTVSVMSAGALRFPVRRFVPLSALCSVLWAAYMAGLGIGAGHWLRGNPLAAALAGIVLGLILGLAFDQIARWRARRAGQGRAS